MTENIWHKIDRMSNELDRMRMLEINLRGQILSYKHKIKSPCDAFGEMLGGEGKAMKKSALERLGLWDLSALKAQVTDEDFIK